MSMLRLLDADAWQEIWATLRRNKLRAFLTACGVFWGIFMLIVMLGIGRGLSRGVVKSLGGLAAHSVYVWAQRTSLPHAGLQPGRYVRFTNEDAAALARLPGVEHVAPRLQLGGWREGVNVVRGAKTSNFNVTGDVPVFAHVEPMLIARGRFVNDSDMADQRKVAVIGELARRFLFSDDEDPIGQYIQIRGLFFQIVGELKSLKAGDEGERASSTIYVPLSTFQGAFNQRGRVGWFTLSAFTGASAVEVERDVLRLLRSRHRIHPDDLQAFGSFNAADKFAKVKGLFDGIQTFVWFVGVLTLLAGVLGVSNILLITVKERTREIGVRKALGATPGSIVGMVVQESVALTALAGYAGVVAGVGVLELISGAVAKLPNAPLSSPEIDLQSALLATLVLIGAGVVAGIVPARHAARIHPVQALRAE
jgi:putative ABC transport system permease protein